MSSKRYDVLTSRTDPKTDKRYFTRIGVAFEKDNGGLDVRLEALPIDGRLLIKEATPYEGRQAEQRSADNRRQRRPNGPPQRLNPRAPAAPQQEAFPDDADPNLDFPGDDL